MRLDRFLTLSVVRPLHRDGARETRVPILMYHSISTDPEDGVHPYFKVCTSPRRFAEQMQWLADAGWRGVTLAEGLKAMASTPDAKRHERLAVLTFDDGFRDFHSAAFPAMQRHGFTATMYLPTAYIGNDRRTFKGRECMTWSEVNEMQAAGFQFGSHTVNHPRLVQLDWTEIDRELRDSKSELEQRLGRAVTDFAYPYAYPQAERAFDSRFREMLRATGYTSNVTTMIDRAGPADDRLLLPRLPANSQDDRALFTAKLSGAYDWMGSPQALTKSVARWVRPGARPLVVRKGMT